MAEPVAPAPATAPQQSAQPSQYSVHECAVDAEKALEKLATELARAGAAPEAVDAVEKMADVTRKIVKALGKGQEQTGDDEPPAREAVAPQPSRPATIASESQALASESVRR